VSTKRREYEYGRIVSVDVVPFGAVLAADVTAGASSITVEDASDFDEDGGQLILAGIVYTYSTWVEDDATGVGTIILTGSTVAANAFEGDAVDVYDPLYLAAASDKVAQVEAVGIDGNIDMLEATIALHLADKVGEDIRGLYGEQVKLEIEGDEWVIVDISGLASTSSTGQASGGVLAEQDSTTVAYLGPNQSIILKHTPIENSEHGYWNGDYQPGSEWSRFDNVVVWPDPDGLIQVGDELVCEYLYTPGTDFIGGSSLELVGTVFYDLDSGTHPGTDFDLALPAGTQAGDMLCLVVSSWVEPAFSADPRFYMSQLITDDIVPGGDFTPSRASFAAVGREDGTGAAIHVSLGSTSWRSVAIVAFRGPRVTSVANFVQVGSTGVVPIVPSPASRFIAVTGTIAGTVAEVIEIPPLPTGSWAEALRDSSVKAGATIGYTPDPAPEVAADPTGITFGGSVGGSTGFCHGFVLGVR